MKVSDHSLRQLDEAYLTSLERVALQGLSMRLVSDLKEARDQLGSGPQNSSRPPGSRPAWEKGLGAKSADADAEAEAEEPPVKSSEPESAKPVQAVKPESTAPALPSKKVPRPAGKQPGAPGVGRTQTLIAQALEEHRPTHCAGCAAPLALSLPGQAYTGFQTVDVRFGEPTTPPGLTLWVTDHRLLEVACVCGHRTCARTSRVLVEIELGEPALKLGTWRLVGPGLAALIVSLAMRFRLSRARIAEFLHDWLGLKLSVGTINATLHEAAAAIAPVEEALIADLLASEIIYADETPWPEQGQIFWLWVFRSLRVTLYYVTHRGRELLNHLLPEFAGWLMSDGWVAYRIWPRRLRCWPHLIRKARGLAESLDGTAQAFGTQVLATFESFMHTIYAARAGPVEAQARVAADCAAELKSLREACERQRRCAHPKTRALGVELLNDWQAIFQVLEHPLLPLSNNEAERALRHWVILRNLSHGTRTAQGSRLFALLASVIDTCRQRGHCPWRYLQIAVEQRRAGRALPPMPV